jgi:hypothetical protein
LRVEYSIEYLSVAVDLTRDAWGNKEMLRTRGYSRSTVWLVSQLAVILCAAPAYAELEFSAEHLIQAGGADICVPGYSVPSFVDWNNDNLEDLVVGEGGSSYSGKVRVYLNAGTQQEPQFTSFFYVQSNGSDLIETAGVCLGAFPRVVYWDSDMRKDLLVGRADGTVKIYLNTNTDVDPRFDGGTCVQVGLPGSKVNIDVGLRATPTVADWNLDGKKDLVIGAYDSKIHVFMNEGSDTVPDFQTDTLAQDNGQDLQVDSARSSPHLVDLDGDGRQDLLSGNTDGELVFYANVGRCDGPTFAGFTYVQADGVIIDLPGAPRSRPFVCDWNADGHLDILMGAGDGKVRLYWGLPEGDIDADGDVDYDDLVAFVQVLLGTPIQPIHVTRADLNHDGSANGDDIPAFVDAILPS